MTTNFAQEERRLLCADMLSFGPDAPTLCGDWTNRDLAAHLIVRERRPDAALGILLPPLEAHGESVRAQTAKGDFEKLVAEVRSGPPWYSPMKLVDRQANTIEFFVHHEDVRRAQEGWEARDLPAEESTQLFGLLRRASKMLLKNAPTGVVLRAPGHGEISAKSAPAERSTVYVTGEPGELVMFVYGRQAHADVTLDGEEGDVEALTGASLGI